MTDSAAYSNAIFVIDPDNGKRLTVECDAEYMRLISAFLASHCHHPTKDTYRIRVANGSVQVRECCITCGQGFGPAKSQRDKAWVEGLPWLSDELGDAYDHRRRAEKQQMLLDLARKQYAERGEHTKSYVAYLASPEWKAKRALVLKRCGGMCEGCGVKPATEVHHWTYEHLFDELLFELLGLCHGCHERITLERRGPDDADPGLADEAQLEAGTP